MATRILSENRQRVRSFGTCLSFNGTSDNVSIASNSGLSPSTQITMAGWIFPLNNNCRIFSKDKSDVSKRSYILKIDSSNRLEFDFFSSTTLKQLVGGSIQPKVWSHIACTYDGTEMVLYINGTVVNTLSTSGSIDTNDTNLLFGKNPSGAGSEFYKGKIDELILYSTALTRTQIQNLYYSSTYLSPIGLWKFDEGSGSSATDSSGNSNTGTITGAIYDTTNIGISTRSYVGSWTTSVEPNTLSGLIGWWKADANVYSDNGLTLAVNNDTVQQWNDQSSNANNVTQATGGLRPTYKTNVLGSKSGLLFSQSAATVLEINDNASLSPTSQVHLIAVASALNTRLDNNQGIVAKAQGALSNPAYELRYGGSGGQLVASITNAGNSNIAVGQLGKLKTGEPSIIECVMNGSNCLLYQNGVLLGTSAAVSNIGDTNGVFRIGSGKTGFPTRYFDGYIFEVILYNVALSANNRQSVEAYLSSKYGINLYDGTSIYRRGGIA